MYQILRAVSQPLLLEPSFGRLFSGILARKLAGEAFHGAQLHAELGIAAPRSAASRTATRIAVIPVHGLIAQHPQSLGTSVDEVDAATAMALNSAEVDGILY